VKTTPCTEKVKLENKQYLFQQARRCGAKTRQDSYCLSPVIKGRRRCRMHGGKGSGPPIGNQNALIHGLTTYEAKMERRDLKLLFRDSKELMLCI
jgi:hypothetical protein